MSSTLSTIKKYIKPLVFVTAGIALSNIAVAEVTLEVDDHIKVTAINGQAINTSLFQPLETSFSLEPGNHVITAKYERLYDLRGDNHDFVRSSNITISAQMQDNQTYHLTMPGQPEAYNEAKEYAQNPTLAVVKGNEIIVQESTVSEEGDGIFGGLGNVFGGIFGDGDDAQTQNQKTIAAIQQSDTDTTQTTTTSSTTTMPMATVNNTNTLDSFMQLWLNATPEEREKIRQWVAQ